MQYKEREAFMYIYHGLTLRLAEQVLFLRRPAPFMTEEYRIDYVPLLEILQLGGIPFTFDASAPLVRIDSDERVDAGEPIRRAKLAGVCRALADGLPAFPAATADQAPDIPVRVVRHERDIRLRHSLRQYERTMYIAAADLPAIIPARTDYNHYDDVIVVELL